MKIIRTFLLAGPVLYSLLFFTFSLRAQGPSACDQFVWIACGDTLLNQTTQGAIDDYNNVNSYICMPDDLNNELKGPDRLYKIVVSQPMSIRFVLEILDSTDLDLIFGLNCPSFVNCDYTIERNQINGIYREVLDVFVKTPGTYGLVVEGKDVFGYGTYNLYVDCSCTCVEPGGDSPTGEVVFCDDFENYLTDKALDPQSTRWMKWDSAAVDGIVSPNGFAGRGARFQTVGSSKPRMIYRLQDNSDPPAGVGRYRISWKMNVATGKTARYNMLHQGPHTGFTNWAYHVTFAADNTGQIRIGNPANSPIATFQYPSGAWMNVMQIVDMNKDTAELWINNNYVTKWKFSTGYTSQGTDLPNNRINALEFVTETDSDFRIDNICAWRKTGNCTGDLPVCVKNGVNYPSTAAARCDLYTSLEWATCNSVCDYGGSFIYRGDQYDGELDPSDLAPELVRIDPCVVSAYGGNVPATLYADIYVFSKVDDDVLDLIVNVDNPATTKTFVFSCNSRNPDGSCTTGQRCLAEIGNSNIYTPLTCDSFYYIVVTSTVVNATYDIQILPNGPCGNSAELLTIFCPDQPGGAGDDPYTFAPSSAPGFDTQSPGNVYESCYGGGLPFSGGEKIFKFVLTHPAAVKVRIRSAVPIGAFLYSFICGKECLAYTETVGNDERAQFVEFLAEGTYFIVVDKGFDSPTDNEFQLAFECVRKSYFDIVKEVGCGGGGFNGNKSAEVEQSSFPYDPGSCDCASYYFQHLVNIKANAFNFSQDDYIQFLFRDSIDGNLTSSARLTKKWDAPPGQDKEYAVRSLDHDLYGNGTFKCSYFGGDTMFIWLTQTTPGSRNFKEMEVLYEDPATTPGVNATNQFVVDTLPNGDIRSSIYSMKVLNTVTFGGTSFGRTVSPTTTQISTKFASSIPWYIEIDSSANWLSVSPMSGNGGGSYDITIDLDENTSAIDRRTVLRFISLDRPDMYRYVMEVRQNGVCIPASVAIQQTPAVACEGDTVILKAFVGFDPNNPDLSLAPQYKYEWSPFNFDDTVFVLTPQALGLGEKTYQVTVTNKNPNCVQSAADTIMFTVSQRPATPTAASPASVKLCADEPLPTLAVNLPPGQPTPTVNWYDQPQGGLLLKENSLTYTPVQHVSAQYYAEAQNPGGCPSLSRRQFSVAVDSLPSLNISDKTCDSTHLTYGFTATTNGIDLQVSPGQKSFSNGIYTIFNIPIDSPVQVTAFNTFCDTVAQVLPPVCVCTVSVPQSGGDQTTCNNQPVPPLTATVPGPHETVDWYAAPTGGTVLPGGQGSPTFQTGIAGSYFAEGRNTLNGCVSSTRTEVHLTIYPVPMLTLTDTICASDLSDYLLGVATTPDAVLSISPPNAGVVSGSNGVFTVSDIAAGQDILLTVTDSTTGCSRSQLVLAPDCACLTLAAPVSGGDAAVCPGQPFPALTVTVGPGLSANWFNANNVVVATNTLSFTPFAPGTYFAQTTDPAGCASVDKTAVTLGIYPRPPLAVDAPLCSPNRQSYSLTATTATNATLSASVGTVTGSNGLFSVGGIPVGEALTLLVTDVGTGCTRDTIVLSPSCPCVQNIAAPNATGSVEICAGAPFPEILVTVGTDQTADWFNALGGVLALGTLQYQPLGAGTFRVTARDTVSDCSSTDSAIVVLSVNPLPDIQVTNKNCDSTLLTYTVTLATQPGVAITPTLGSVSGGNGLFVVYNIPEGTNLTVMAENTSTGCTAALLVTAPVCACDTTIQPPISGGNQSVCFGQALPLLSVNDVGAGRTVVWYNAAGLEVGQGLSYMPNSPGTYFAETRNLVDDCRSLTRTAVSLSVNPTPTLVLADTICSENLLTYSLEVLTDGTDILVAPAFLKIPTGPGAFAVLNIPVGTVVTITAVNGNTGCTFERQLSVNVCPCPVLAAPTNLGDQEICQGDPIPLLHVSVHKPTQTADWYSSATGGLPIINGGIGTLDFQPTLMETRTYFAQTRDTETNCISAVRTPVALTVRAPASVSAGLDQTVCAGEQVPLSVTLLGVDGGSWSANVPGGLFFPNNNAVSAQFYLPPAGTSAVTLTLTSTNPEGPCPAVSDAMTIMVNPLPTVVLDTAYCAPNLLTYSVEFVSDALLITAGAGVLTSLGNNRYRISGISKGAALTVEAENADCFFETTFPVPDCACPFVAPPVVPPLVSVCANEPFPLIFAQVGPDETVDWYSAETGGVLLAPDTVRYRPGFAGTFYAQAKNRTNGCTSARVPVQVEQRPLPQANAGPDQAVCPGQPAVLIAASGTNYTYLWSTGETTPSITVMPSATTTYYLEVTLNDCQAFDSVVVAVQPAVLAEISQISPIRCFGDANGVVRVNATGGTPGFSYQWSNGSVLETVGSLAAGMYSVTVTDDAGCQATATFLLTAPNALVITNVSTTNATPGQADGTLQVTAQGGTMPYKYQWFQNDTLLVGEAFDLLDSLPTGSYSVTVTDSLGCVVSSGPLLIGSTLVGDPVWDAVVSMYPNPTTGVLYVRLDLPASTRVASRVLDAIGREVLQQEHGTHQTGLLTVDLSRQASGIYFVQLLLDEHIITKKINRTKH